MALSGNSFFSKQDYNLSFSGNTHQPSLMGPTTSSPSFNLGVDLSIKSPDFGLQIPSSVASSPSIFDVQIKEPGFGLVMRTATALIDLPKEVKQIGLISSAAIAGKKLSENIDKSLDSGQPVEEAYACQTVRTLSEELSGKSMKGLITGGIVPYLTAATTNPLLAATVPVVLPLIPTAYQGAQVAASVVGNVAEQACHSAFDSARKIANGTSK
jgi:hypothetical protein